MTGPGEVGPDAVHASRGAPENRTGHGERGAAGDTALASGPATPGPDLAALREKAEKADGYHVLVHPDVLLSVLSLVDDLRAALTYVGEFARAHHHQQPAHVLLHGLTIDIPELVERALAGSPAANEEQQ